MSSLTVEKLLTPSGPRPTMHAPRHVTPLAEWRAAALKKLPLEKVYGPYLTGKKSEKGWLECRDPASPSGDRSASAGVADDVEETERGTFHSFRSAPACDVFTFLQEHGGAKTLRAAQVLVATLSAHPLPPEVLSARPLIQIGGRQFRETMHDAWEALLQVNADSPKLFRRGGTLVRLATDRELASLETVTKEWLFTWLAAWADWIKLTPWGEQPTKPDKDVVRSILEAPSKRLPRIDIVTHAPFFARSGELIAAPGYHSSEATYLAPPEGWRMAEVSCKPAPSQIVAARELLREVVCDFPFVSPADRAHIFSALLTPFIRRIVNGPVPLHLVEAPTPGTGKSMLCQVVSIVAQGTKVAASVFSQSKEEQRKVIFAVLLQAPSVVLLDNVDSDDRTGRLESDVLAAVLTGDELSDRLLGLSKRVSAPNTALWLMTGNNPKLSMELARRAVRCRLDASSEDPWLRTEFTHSDLFAWTYEKRPRLVHALLTLVTAWLREGQPEGERILGSFERWSRVVGGIFEVAGIEGFLGNLNEFYDEGDAETSDWTAFVAAWWEHFGPAPKSARELLEMAKGRDLLPEVYEGFGERSSSTRLGKRLQKHRDRIYAGKRVGASSDRDRPYQLREVSGGSPDTVVAKAAPTSGTSGTSGTIPLVADEDVVTTADSARSRVDTGHHDRVEEPNANDPSQGYAFNDDEDDALSGFDEELNAIMARDEEVEGV